ncbi:MAG: hypothetical protein QOD50_1916 [Actinomycetota bacterium]|jgi:hypothetical protein|nr:hypothetical protein [Actinomycetota bacterium]
MTRRTRTANQTWRVPFTPSHVAAVLPFAGTPLLPAALVIGSMGPDLFYYVPLPIDRSFTHSWLGVVTVDLVLGVALFVLWQLVFRTPLIDFMPLAARRRIAAMPWSGIRPRGMSWARLGILLVVSVLIGTATHVVWDSFTHPDWVVYQLSWLRQQWGPNPVYEWAQYFSSVFGAAVVLIWTIRWWRRTRPVDAAATRISRLARVLAWVSVLGIGLVVALAIWVPEILKGQSPVFAALVFRTVTVGLAAAGLAALLWSLAWWLLRPRATTA